MIQKITYGYYYLATIIEPAFCITVLTILLIIIWNTNIFFCFRWVYWLLQKKSW